MTTVAVESVCRALLPPLLDEQRRGLRRDADMHRLAHSRRHQCVTRAMDLDADQLRAYRHHLRDLAPSKLNLPNGARPCAHNAEGRITALSAEIDPRCSWP